jgi:phosphopantothenoylcysteine decarboxylase/phosphopantothenate--cysteine ligase
VLEGRRVVLGVSGGIAAYKAIEVCRRLVDRGAHVVPVMTRGATRFVGETTFSALASEPVHRSLFEDADPIPHTRLGQSADVVVVAPATARVIGCYAAGISNDLLTATLLATEAPVVVCPAMHTEMWRHPAVQDNIASLARRGVRIVGPEEGRLAGGDTGEGRLASPDAIVAGVEAALGATRDLAGLHVVVTAGGTREPIDPVRFVGNRSSGKQGHALADEAAARGAKVTLVTTVALPVPAGVDVVRVETAAQMDEAVRAVASGADVVVMAAAVADFRPAHVSEHKIKKRGGVPDIVLEPTVDILAGLGRRKRPGQTLVGFAAETDRVRQNATSKLVAKGADLIVANDVTAPGAGFEHDTNHVVILNADGTEREVPLAAKRATARAVFDAVLHRRQQP